MATVVIHPRADAQIIDVLGYTLEEFGESKYVEYRGLIGLAKLAAVIAAIWLLPAFVVPDAYERDMRFWQALATAALLFLNNFFFDAIVERIRHPDA